ncbi:hypothetical protein K432DRAFT_396344 [Lepidopterella palustris CBS 459.81]|uniref:Uncharacterized protein n=1 Tax=Lepidopterella palustris CBS 459.81 TaxID=1314670 RepID=A0A8E2E360_9PEZI|nr:hypothetical protein K432DRAFT_396344 [Lepidopterella palustris CBS 459.81]
MCEPRSTLDQGMDQRMIHRPKSVDVQSSSKRPEGGCLKPSGSIDRQSKKKAAPGGSLQAMTLATACPAFRGAHQERVAANGNRDAAKGSCGCFARPPARSEALRLAALSPLSPCRCSNKAAVPRRVGKRKESVQQKIWGTGTKYANENTALASPADLDIEFCAPRRIAQNREVLEKQ